MQRVSSPTYKNFKINISFRDPNFQVIKSHSECETSSELRRSTKEVCREATFLSSHNIQLSSYSITTHRRYTKRKGSSIDPYLIKRKPGLSPPIYLSGKHATKLFELQKEAAKNVKRIKAT